MENKQKHNDSNSDHEKFIRVAISTTSGFYPAEGFEQVPIHQKIEVLLKKAAEALHLTDTTRWIATIDKKAIDPHQSYEENGLNGEVEIDWGPSEGGGGNA